MNRFFSKEVISQIPLEELLRTIINVADYREFVPWCKETKIISKSQHEMTAKLITGNGVASKSYTSHITWHSEDDLSRGEVRIRAISYEVFKHMASVWKLKKLGDETLVRFEISFEFKSYILDKIVVIKAEEAIDKMTKAFEKRATLTSGIDNIDLPS